MNAAADIRVEALDARGFAPLAAEAASVYGAAMDRSPEIVVQRREVIASHLRHPGFVSSVARPLGSEELLGFGYGYHGAPGQWWHDVVARELGRAGTRRWLREAFELAELHVRPDHHGRGIGRRLLLDLLDRADAAHVVLSTPDVDSPARALYRSAGFTDLVCGFYFPGSAEAYAVMGLDR